VMAAMKRDSSLAEDLGSVKAWESNSCRYARPLKSMAFLSV
jgi:hypothetical protein